jgi:hypothetical protein
MPFDAEKQINQLVNMYRQGFNDVLQILAAGGNRDLMAYYRDVLIQLRDLLGQLDANAAAWIEQTIGQVYSQSAAETAAFLMSLGIQRQVNPEFAQLHQRAIDVIAQNMADNLRDATQFIGRRVDDAFRRVGIEQAGRKYASGTTIQDMKRKVMQAMLDEGQTAFIDKIGRRWRLDTYAEMVARTTTREAASVATLNECKEFDIDLVRISFHYPTCEICAPLQGKVYSISGKDKRYPALKDEYRPPIHPNCQHVLEPYVREFDDKADEVQELSNKPLTKDPRSEQEIEDYKNIVGQPPMTHAKILEGRGEAAYEEYLNKYL